MNTESNNLALHFKYFAFIATMVIIAVATDRWSAKPDFTTYLSNAATLTSLLLGVVAIFYSFISNDSMSRSLGSISTVSADVRNTSDQIEQFVELTKAATEVSSRNNESVRDASTNLSGALSALNSTLASISTQNEALQSLIASLPSRIVQLETKVGDVAKALGEKPTQPQATASPADITEKAIDKFLSRASLSQNLLMYAVVLAANHKQPLSIPEFCKAVDFEWPSTFTGFLGCMHAMQICTRKAVEGKEKVFTISNVHPALVSKTKDYFKEYVSSTYSHRPDDHKNWMTKLEKLDSLYL